MVENKLHDKYEYLLNGLSYKLPETASVANSTGDARLFAPSADRNSTPIINLIKEIAPKLERL